MLTDSPTTDGGYAEAASRPTTEKGEDQRALRAASLRALMPSPEFQSLGSTPSPEQTIEQTIEADTQPEFRGEDMIGTSSPVGDDNVYATPAATPPPAPEEEEGPRMPTGTLSPSMEPQLRVSPKRKVENVDLDLDASAELPAVQKKARAGSGCASASEDEHQWDNIPPPRDTDWRLAGRLPWGSTTMMLGRLFSENSHRVDLPPGGQASESESAAADGESVPRSSTGDGVRSEETESLYSAASDLTQVMTSVSPSQSQPVMMGARPRSSCSVDSRHSDFRSPPPENATEPYRTCAGRMMLHREDWTYYAQQDEARPGDLHLEWPESMKTVRPIGIPVGYEGTFRQEHSKPHALTFHGRVLRRKHGLKVPKSWGNAQERPSIRRTMEEGAEALSNDRDWIVPLMECHSDSIPFWPLERYYPSVWPWLLHMNIPAPWGSNNQTFMKGSFIAAFTGYH